MECPVWCVTDHESEGAEHQSQTVPLVRPVGGEELYLALTLRERDGGELRCYVGDGAGRGIELALAEWRVLYGRLPGALGAALGGHGAAG